jgi:outer membrane protein OmpA-like peptidoglycan-associated protein
MNGMFIARPRYPSRRLMLVFGLTIAVGLATSVATRATSILPLSVVYFESDDATLNETQKAQLDQVIADEAFRDKTLVVTGHYDHTGSAKHRNEMSQRYAETVKDYLVAAGLPPGTLLVYWRGDDQLAKRAVTIQPQ